MRGQRNFSIESQKMSWKLCSSVFFSFQSFFSNWHCPYWISLSKSNVKFRSINWQSYVAAGGRQFQWILHFWREVFVYHELMGSLTGVLKLDATPFYHTHRYVFIIIDSCTSIGLFSPFLEKNVDDDYDWNMNMEIEIYASSYHFPVVESGFIVVLYMHRYSVYELHYCVNMSMSISHHVKGPHIHNYGVEISKKCHTFQKWQSFRLGAKHCIWIPKTSSTNSEKELQSLMSKMSHLKWIVVIS